ncbi:hypothetical protein EVA_15374 [gut metagenome]|uniref:Uncharacterized protein n=1 Tax=gut metagenome TaxID=749906 RepID=J9FNJ9_9ZZZZ
MCTVNLMPYDVFSSAVFTFMMRFLQSFAKETQDSHDKNSCHDLHVFVNIDMLY